MQDLDIDIETIAPWFTNEQTTPFILVRVSESNAASWPEILSEPVRQCYIADTLLDNRAQTTGYPRPELVAAKLPAQGSTMAGDFGEILVFLYHGAIEPEAELIGPKKWQLKQDRTKPAPFSDVVQFALPHWPDSSTEDRILCSEVKTKSTTRASSPISAAIADCEKDRISRLAKTLVWLKERALHDDLGSTTIAHLDRFIKSTDHPEPKKQFYAVAIICESLVNNELVDAPVEQPTDHTVIVIAVPDLKRRYEEVFEDIHSTVAETEGNA